MLLLFYGSVLYLEHYKIYGVQDGTYYFANRITKAVHHLRLHVNGLSSVKENSRALIYYNHSQIIYRTDFIIACCRYTSPDALLNG